jgi:predicted deacylase
MLFLQRVLRYELFAINQEEGDYEIMKTALIFETGIKVEPGEKAQTSISVPGTDVSIPVTIINGVNEGKRIVITSGIHSGEYPGIQCAIELAQEIDPKEVSGVGFYSSL